MLSAQPRVFVSSVVENFEAYRQAAEAGARGAGMLPVLVNEQSPSRPDSSRNACLDAISTCDAFILIIGERGGWQTPSGKLVVEEELDEAIRRKLPVLVFLHETAREPSATTLTMRVSDYVAGRFRRSFKTPGELRFEVEAALNELSPTMNLDETDLTRAFAGFSAIDRVSYQDASTRLRIVPLRATELIDPIQFSSKELQRELIFGLMQPRIALFDVAFGHKCTSSADTVSLVEEDQHRHGGLNTRFEYTEQGHCLVAVALREPRGAATEMLSSMVLDIASIERALVASFAAVGSFYDRLDPHMRHTGFAFNCGLWHLGHRVLERNPTPRSSHSVRMGGDDPIVAYDQPRKVSRADLTSPANEVARALALIVRKADRSW